MAYRTSRRATHEAVEVGSFHPPVSTGYEIFVPRMDEEFICEGIHLSSEHYRNQRHRTVGLQFAVPMRTPPLKYLVRVYTFGLRHPSHAGSRLQRQLHNSPLLLNRPPPARLLHDPSVNAQAAPTPEGNFGRLLYTLEFGLCSIAFFAENSFTPSTPLYAQIRVAASTSKSSAQDSNTAQRSARASTGNANTGKSAGRSSEEYESRRSNFV